MQLLINYHINLTIFYQWHFFIKNAKFHHHNFVHNLHSDLNKAIAIGQIICYNIEERVYVHSLLILLRLCVAIYVAVRKRKEVSQI